MRSILFLSAFLLQPSAFLLAATLTTDGSQSDTAAKITSAASGDTVILPASGGPFTWASAVTIPSTKYITLDLNGRTVNLTAQFTVNAHASGHNRVTNGSLVRSDSGDPFNGRFSIGDERGSAAVRVDHVTFTFSGGNDATLITINGKGPGLMDHCTFTGLTFAQEFIHIDAWGSGDSTGWTLDTGDTLAGSANIFYIEDCSFTQAASQGGTSWIQGYYGCRVAIRHNTFNHVSVDMHGTPGNVGARWWEFYENVWSNSVGGTGSSPLMNMRAGSGVCHNNAASGSGQANSIQLCEEDSGYPANFQIGRGLSQALDPARVWNNTGVALEPDVCDAPEVSGMVQLNRDVYASARSGYTAYTYPHPLQGAAPLAAQSRVRKSPSPRRR